MLKTILIADDEDVVVDIARRRLTQAGYMVIGVNDGAQALQVLREGRVDLIVLDIEMPGMNGYTFMNERQKIPGGADAPVVVLTAYNSMEPIFRRHGVAGYLVKPLKFEDFLAKIKEVLGDPVVNGA